MAAVDIPNVTRSVFSDYYPRVALFGGHGTLNGHEVFVKVKVFDGHGTTYPDAMAVTCYNQYGLVVYYRAGYVVQGDIVVQ